ncbi:hypothetical protein ACI48D_21050 [Massilia sp. LXY-6]
MAKSIGCSVSRLHALTRALRKATGMTPAAYRRRQRAGQGRGQ